MPQQVQNKIEPVSSLSLVLREFLDGVIIDHPTMKTVYDEGLSFDSALKKFRGDQDMAQETERFVPAFIFNREPMVYQEGLQLRNRAQRACILENDNTGSVYRFVAGRVSLNYIMIFRDMASLERMESLILAGQGFTSNRILSVHLPGIGEYNYTCEYDPVSDKQVTYENTIYKSLTGRVTIDGTYIFYAGKANVIKEVQTTVTNFQDSVWMNTNCIVD